MIFPISAVLFNLVLYLNNTLVYWKKYKSKPHEISFLKQTFT